MGQSKDIPTTNHLSPMEADLEDGMLIASPFPWTALHLVKLNFCALSLVLFGRCAVLPQDIG